MLRSRCSVFIVMWIELHGLSSYFGSRRSSYACLQTVREKEIERERNLDRHTFRCRSRCLNLANPLRGWVVRHNQYRERLKRQAPRKRLTADGKAIAFWQKSQRSHLSIIKMIWFNWFWMHGWLLSCKLEKLNRLISLLIGGEAALL